MSSCENEYFAINNYGVIGDLHTVALINSEGGIDWCCLPIFDSPSVFASILDHKEGGSFKVFLGKEQDSRLSYLNGTNILTNALHTEEGSIELIDYMPIFSSDKARKTTNDGHICRHIECTKGVNLRVNVHFNPRPNYGDKCTATYSPHSVRIEEHNLTLRSSHPIVWDGETGQGYITISHGDSARMVMSCGELDTKQDLELWTDRTYYETRQYWESWLNQCLYKGRWRRMVERSALTLKLLTYQPTGAILAAPTASLPEGIGGSRNWDYRFSWLRDSALILNALLPLGFTSEAKEYVDWIIKRRPEPGEPMPILFSITDVDTTKEEELPQFEGYMKSAPVRIGNAACDQVQLDVYGEVIDSLFINTIFGNKPDDAIWDYIVDLAERICVEWKDKDEGIWEVRGDKQHFTYSKLMCWTGLDRAIRIGQDNSFEGDYAKWQKIRDEISDFILEECVDKEKKHLTQHPNNSAADASNLLAVIIGFLPPTHEIMINTVNETKSQLLHNNMLYRYLTEDGLEGHEGTFNICTFWLVEALSMQGRVEESEEIFNSMLEHSSNIGLYAEETDAENNVALGNFPQAFSHVGLINAAVILNSQGFQK